MENKDLIVGHCYKSKRPRRVFMGLYDFFDDRQVIWTNGYYVQYDSPTIKFGQNYKKITVEEFLKWADEDITDIMPKDDWREWEAQPNDR